MGKVLLKLLCASLLCLALICGDASAAEVTCPPADFDTVPDFNVTKYITAPWYIQQQMVNSYQLERDFYCVRTQYVPVDPEDYNKGIIVQNYRNRGGINQNPGGSSGAGGSPCYGYDQIKGFPALATNTKPTDASKILVGPAPVATFGKSLLGDYWVVAVGASKNETIGYDWAIVSAGAPTVSTPGGCRTGTVAMQTNPAVINGVGLWLFSRKPVDPEGAAVMREKAQELGFNTDVLLNVTQEGCTYIKADPDCPAEDAPHGCGGGIRDFIPDGNMTGLPFNLSLPGNLSGLGNLTNFTAGLPRGVLPSNFSSGAFNFTPRCFNDSGEPGPANSSAPPSPSSGASGDAGRRASVSAAVTAAGLMVALLAYVAAVLP